MWLHYRPCFTSHIHHWWVLASSHCCEQSSWLEKMLHSHSQGFWSRGTTGPLQLSLMKNHAFAELDTLFHFKDEETESRQVMCPVQAPQSTRRAAITLRVPGSGPCSHPSMTELDRGLLWRNTGARGPGPALSCVCIKTHTWSSGAVDQSPISGPYWAGVTGLGHPSTNLQVCTVLQWCDHLIHKPISSIYCASHNHVLCRTLPHAQELALMTSPWLLFFFPPQALSPFILRGLGIEGKTGTHWLPLPGTRFGARASSASIHIPYLSPNWNDFL